jgi:hypothetical protein
MSQTVTLHRASNLLVYFTFEWGALEAGEEGLLEFALDGVNASPESPFEWGFAGNVIPHSSGTVTWSFADVPAGTHMVAARGRVQGGDLNALLDDCALTVFVTPSVEQAL